LSGSDGTTFGWLLVAAGGTLCFPFSLGFGFGLGSGFGSGWEWLNRQLSLEQVDCGGRLSGQLIRLNNFKVGNIFSLDS
jgi:hypothetical protein